MGQVGKRWIETMGFRQRDPMNVFPTAELKKIAAFDPSCLEVAACESQFFGHVFWTRDLLVWDRTLFVFCLLRFHRVCVFICISVR